MATNLPLNTSIEHRVASCPISAAGYIEAILCCADAEIVLSYCGRLCCSITATSAAQNTANIKGHVKLEWGSLNLWTALQQLLYLG